MGADLAVADPANAARYQSNLKAFEQRLDALDQRLKARLTGVADKPFFVFHEAFDYFESAYGLKACGRIQRGGGSAAGRAACGSGENAQALAGSGQDLCVQRAAPASAHSRDADCRAPPVKLAELDALGGTLSMTAEGYEQLLEGLGNGLAGCLEGL